MQKTNGLKTNGTIVRMRWPFFSTAAQRSKTRAAPFSSATPRNNPSAAFLLIITLIGTTQSAYAGKGTVLNAEVQSAIAGFKGTVSVYAENMDSPHPTNFGMGADTRIRTASTIKLAILAATFAAVDEGKIKWTDLSTLHDPDRVAGAGVLGHEFSDGARLPLIDLVHLMIVMSDNTATNLVLDRVPMDDVNDYMDKLGFKQTRSMHKIGANFKDAGISREGNNPANQRFGLGSTTPREMVALIEKMERGEIVSPAASKEMIKILKRQQDRNGIPRGVEKTWPDTPIANKTGALDHLRSDVGIVYSKHGRIAIAITCDDIPKVDWSSDNPGLLLIAKLSQVLVAGLAN
jgi:beta-lactamase class A